MADIRALCERLKREKSHVEADLARLENETRRSDETREGSPFGKREEGATEAFELEKRLALQRGLRDTLNEVELALKKCDLGTFGLCDRCGQAIEPARLEALPTASLCLKCKSLQMKDARHAR